ncbi:MAG TPA: SDR family oxidoreductase [Thermoanaerobaculia bacterium]|nr:SDR family oxidoreductase [Thermoanaerobaculia bacterium]
MSASQGPPAAGGGEERRPELPPVAVISGGGSGLGLEIARELGRRGYALALLGRRREALAAALAASGCETAGGLALACDVRDPQAVARAAAAIEERWGAAEIVVPAAGVAHIFPLEETTVEQFAATVETNLTGSFLLLRALLPAMKRRGRGRIFALLSVAARRGFAGWSAYCASKWGLAGLLAALREELAGSGVQLTALYPGATDTSIWEALPGTWDRAAMMPSAEVARALGFALDADPRTAVEEIHFGPVGGAL